MPPPSQDRAERGGGGSSGNPLRDFMLKAPDSNPRGPQPGTSREPRNDGHHFSKVTETISHYFNHVSSWLCFSSNFANSQIVFIFFLICFKFSDIWRQGPQKAPEEQKEDRGRLSFYSFRKRLAVKILYDFCLLLNSSYISLQIWTLQCLLGAWIRFWRHLLVRHRASPESDHSSSQSQSLRWWNLMGWEKQFIIILSSIIC